MHWMIVVNAEFFQILQSIVVALHRASHIALYHSLSLLNLLPLVLLYPFVESLGSFGIKICKVYSEKS
jgi:hypothetical protein